jgi:hypothetical protein
MISKNNSINKNIHSSIQNISMNNMDTNKGIADDKYISLGNLYGSNMPMHFYYCLETDEFYKKRSSGASMEKVIDSNEIRRLRMRLQNIMEV